MTSASPPYGAHPKGITWRSVAIGFAVGGCHVAWIVYEETAWGHLGISATAASIIASALALLFVLLIVNSGLRRVAPNGALSPGELAVIFTIITMSAVMAGFDLLQNLVPSLMFPFRSTEASRWAKYAAHMPLWLAPRSDSVVAGFFAGNTSFFRPEFVRAWAVPIAVWTGFLMVIVWTGLCLNTIMQRHWAHRERLNFPTLFVPLQMCGAGGIENLLGNRVLLVGFCVPVVLESMNVLHGMFPSVPGIQLNVYNIARFITAPPWTAANPLFMAWWPVGIGLAYFVPLDLLFSCWFFYFARKGFEVMWFDRGWGATSPGGAGAFPFTRELSYGAWAGLFVILLWGARSHVAGVLRDALRRRATADGEAPMSPHAAVLGVAVGYCLLVGFAVACGARLPLAAAYFLVFLLATVAMCRVYSQVGL